MLVLPGVAHSLGGADQLPRSLVALLFRRAIWGMPEIELARRSDLLPSYCCSGRKFDESYEKPLGSCPGCRVMRQPPLVARGLLSGTRDAICVRCRGRAARRGGDRQVVQVAQSQLQLPPKHV